MLGNQTLAAVTCLLLCPQRAIWAAADSISDTLSSQVPLASTYHHGQSPNSDHCPLLPGLAKTEPTGLNHQEIKPGFYTCSVSAGGCSGHDTEHPCYCSLSPSVPHRSSELPQSHPSDRRWHGRRPSCGQTDVCGAEPAGTATLIPAQQGRASTFLSSPYHSTADRTC